MNQSRFRRAIAAVLKTLTRQVRHTIRVQGVPISDAQRAEVAAALLPHIQRARVQSHNLGVKTLEPQARALGVTTPPAQPIRPYTQRAVETMLENVTNATPPTRRSRVTVDGVPAEEARGPRVSMRALDPVTRRRSRVTVDVTEENRRDPDVVKIVTARLEAAAERHARMPSRQALTDALDATPVVPLLSDDADDADEDELDVTPDGGADPNEEDFVWDDDDLISPDSPAARKGAVIGWARVLSGAESCAWCAMLASRGPVFNSKRDAKFITSRSERFDSRKLDTYHDNCDCEVVMVREGVDWGGREQYEALEQLWIESTAGTSGSGAVNAFEQAFNQRVADGDADQFFPNVEDESADKGDVPPVDPPAASITEPGDGDAPEPRSAEDWGIPRLSFGPLDRRHILDGEPDNVKKGGHRPGTGRDNKTEFPEGWTDDRIMAAVELTEAEPQYAYRGGDRTVRLREIDGVIVEVSSYPQDGVEILHAAFPKNGHGVIVNKEGKREAVQLDRNVLYPEQPDGSV